MLFNVKIELNSSLTETKTAKKTNIKYIIVRTRARTFNFPAKLITRLCIFVCVLWNENSILSTSFSWLSFSQAKL